jgi:beta-glucuronidase
MNYRTLTPTFTVESINHIPVPFSGGDVYPSFDPQPNPIIDLKGTWYKQRVNNPNLTIRIRDEEALRKLRSELPGITTTDYAGSLVAHTLPGVENVIHHRIAAHNDGMETYEGGAWYRRVINLNKAADKVYVFKALAMAYIADLFINDVYIGTHEGSFNPFAFDVTKALIDGDNVFALRVHNIPWGSRLDVIPAQSGTDYFNYTGVIHEFWIEVLPQTSIRRVDVIPLDGQHARVSIIAKRCEAAEVAYPLTLSVHRLTLTPQTLSETRADRLRGAKVLGPIPASMDWTGDIGTASLVMPTTELEPWALRRPSLYVLTVETPFESFHQEFGVRTVDTRKLALTLNDHPVFLNGMARHEDSVDFGRSQPLEDLVKDAQALVDLGLNFSRTAHYPNHAMTYRILDRLGIATQLEVPLWQHEDAHFKAQRKRKIDLQMWREMIFAQRNRPGVLLWSTQNECNGNTYRTGYNRLLVNDWKKHYFDGRLSTQSSAADRPGYSDPSMAPLDVVGFTMYFGVFHGQPHNTGAPFVDEAYTQTKQFLIQAQRIHRKPIIVSEYGIWSSAGDQVQHAIALNSLKAFSELRGVDFDGTPAPKGVLAGINYWTINDWFVNHNHWTQTMGFYTLDRQPKPILGTIGPLLRRLTENAYALRKDSTLWVGDKYLWGQGGELLRLKTPVNLTNFPFLVLELDDSMFTDGFTLVIESATGEITAVLVPKTADPTIIHLWALQNVNLSQMVALSIETNETERRIHVRSVRLCMRIQNFIKIS